MSDDLGRKYRECFIAELRERGFVDRGDARDALDGYVGEVATPHGPQRVRITLPAAFPYRGPNVFALGHTTRRRHEDPETGALCLWPTEGAGWDPNFTMDDLFARVRQWFIYDANGSWPVEDRPPDLHFSIGRVRSDRLLLTGDDWPPASGQWGRFAVWDDGFLLTLAANARIGNNSAPLRAEDPFVKTYGAATDKGTSTIGLWFRLTEEPPAPRSIADLLGILERHGHDAEAARTIIRSLLGEKVRTPTRLYFALGYPDPDRIRATEERWLFADADVPAGAKWQRMQEVALHGYETAPGDADALRRRLGLVEVDLRDKRVAIFGLGSLGSPLALLLAKGGIGHLALYDGDRLRPGNVIRHVGQLRVVGFTKAVVTAGTITERLPGTDVVPERTTWNPTAIAKAIAETDIVVDATATPSFTLLLADRCGNAGKPLVTLVSHHNGRIGRIQVFRPGQDPCPQCYRSSTDPAVVPDFRTDDAFVETGCGDPTSYASAVDLEAISNAGAQAVLRVLAGTQRANQVFVVNSADADTKAPLDQEGTAFQTNARDPDCALCR